jgi:glycosyltransferase involved in cell wall biosynthesis
MGYDMSNSKPLFSIIITCYNYQSYVCSAIESVLRQTHTDYEIIVVNDGSTDDSWSAISRYSDQVTAINTENHGFISACMTGLAASRGAYVLFLDADDLLNETALSTVAEQLTPQTSKIQYKLQPIDADGHRLGDPFPNLSPDYDRQKMIESINRLGLYPTPPTSGNIYRRDVYLTIGPIDYDFGIDGVAYLVAPFKGDVIHIDEALGQYRIHNNNMSGFGSGSYSKMEREITVFRQRLEHLDRLIVKDPGATGSFLLKPDYLYTVEREAFIEVLKGRRLRFKSMCRYLAHIGTSLTGTERLSYGLFGFLLFAAPAAAGRRLLDFRINPRQDSPLRRFAKRLVRS